MLGLSFFNGNDKAIFNFLKKNLINLEDNSSAVSDPSYSRVANSEGSSR